jgi:7-cyano-7-deazaguanine synthase in queuosine biosynthesis
MIAKSRNLDKFVHDFTVLISGKNCAPENSIPVILGKDISLDFQTLQGRCSSFLSPEDEDLLLVAVSIAHIDRRVTRKISEWRRNIVVRLPVNCPDKWSELATSNALSRCLDLLTGDYWQFKFYQRPHASISKSSQTGLPFLDANAVIPYSGGLDSKATFALAEGKSSPLAVTVLHGSKSKSQSLKDDQGIQNSWIGIELRVNHGRCRETSYRTRSFLFLVLCAVVARKFEITQILIPETGQGAIGSAIIPWGYDHSQYGSHPLFTQHLREFLRQLWGAKAPNFEHPNLWLTKGELLREFVKLFESRHEAEQAILSRHSCSQWHQSRLKGASVHGMHCGICPNCLLRRLSLVSAGLEDVHAREPYIWKNLSASQFSDMPTSWTPGNVVEFSSNKRDQDIARSSFILHRDFARLASKSLSDLEIRRHANRLAVGTGLAHEFCLFSLSQLIRRHAEEWLGFVEQQIGRNSWFKDLV